jgi:type I restriction enzyme S subunit
MDIENKHIKKKTTLAPKLRFSAFSAKWNIILLDDVADRGSGHTPSKSFPNYYNGDIKWVSLADSKKLDKGYIDDTEIKISLEGIKHSSAVIHPKESVLLSRDAGVGKSAVMKTEMAVSQHFIVWQGKKNILSNWFLYHIMQILKPEFERIAIGSTIKTIGLPYFKKLKIAIPNYPEQQKIASFLSAVDKKIQLLNRKKQLLEQYKKGVMQQLFSGKLRFKDGNGKTYPKWEEKKLGDVCDCMDNMRKPINDAERQTMQGTIPYWGANKIMDYVNDYLFDETIVLLAEDGGNFNEYATRPIANISYGKCWVNNHTHVLKGKRNLSNEFLFYSLVHKNITGFVSGGTRAKLNKSEMLKIPIIYPSIEEQKKIADFLSAIDVKIENLSKQINQTQNFKKGLLQQMFV